MQPTPIKSLPLPASGVINHICHISDIHIRSGAENNDPKLSRFDEYINVFDKIVCFLQHTYGESNDMVICITGDIVHHHRIAGAPCIELFFEIMHKLSAIAPVYIIRGNHDYNQASIAPQDMITAFMNGLKLCNNVAYLNTTGYYDAGNVGFGVMAIQDVLIAGNTCGRVESLPTFPIIPDNPKHTTKVALFHGDVPKTYPIEWFGNTYDYILLGDLHRMQIYNASPETDMYTMESIHDVYKMNTYKKSNKKPMWGYPGSTIQQNMGESLLGHGFLMWNVGDKSNQTVDAFHVPNDHGMINTMMGDGSWKINMSYPTNIGIVDSWVNIKDAVAQRWMPSQISLRIKKQSDDLTDSYSYTEIVEEFAKYNLIIKTSKEIGSLSDYISNTESITFQDTLDLRKFNNPRYWCDFITQSVPSSYLTFNDWTSWLTNPESLLFKDKDIPEVHHVIVNLKNDILERNKKMQSALDDYKKARDMADTTISSHTQFELVHMDWGYILCYKDGCHFNFSSLKGKVHCIGGRNGYGKTSFLESICIALFGEGFPSRSNKNYTAAIICMQKPKNSRAFTSIVFSIDSTTFRLKRTFEHQNDTKLHTKEIVLEKLDITTSNFIEIHSGKKATNEWIHVNMGTVESFLTSCIITQGFDEDFFNKKTNDQKQYLDQQLRLDSSSAFHAFLKSAFLAYDDISRRIMDLRDIRKVDDKKHLQTFDPEVFAHLKTELETVSCNEFNLATKHAELESVWSMFNKHVLAKGKPTLLVELDDIQKAINDLNLSDGEDLDTILQAKGRLMQSFEEVRKYHTPNVPLERHMLTLAEWEEVSPTCVEPTDNFDVIDNEVRALELMLTAIDIKIVNNDVTSLSSVLETTSSVLSLIETSLTQHVGDLRDAQQQRTMILQQYKDLHTHKPNPFRITETDYIEWARQVARYVEKYKSQSSLKKLITSNKKPKLDRPTLSEKEIQNAHERLDKWQTRMMSVCGIDGDVSSYSASDAVAALTQLISDSERTLIMFEQKIKETTQVSETHKNTLAEHERSCVDLKNKQLVLLENKPHVPAFTTTKERNKEYKVFTKLAKTKADLESKNKNKNCDCDDRVLCDAIVTLFPMMDLELKNIRTQLVEKQKLIESCDRHDFNPNCKACMTHPWKQRLDEVEDQCRQLNANQTAVLDTMISKFGRVIQSESEYVEAKRVATLYAEMDKINEEYTRQAMFWEQQEGFEKAYNTWLSDRKMLDLSIETTQKKTTNVINLVKATEGTLDELKMRISQARKSSSTMLGYMTDWDAEFNDVSQDVKTNIEAMTAWAAWDAVNAQLVGDLQAWTSLSLMEKEHTQQIVSRQENLKWETDIQNTQQLLEHLDASVIALEVNIKTSQKELDTKRSIWTTTSAQRDELIKQQIEYTSSKKRLDTCTCIMNALMEWKNWREKLENQKKVIMATQLHIDIEQHTKLIENVKARDLLISKLNDVQGALQVVDAYNAFMVVEKTLFEARVRKQELVTRVDHLETMRLQHLEAISTLESLTNLCSHMTSMTSTLKSIMAEFVNFKEWVLENNIIPVIQLQVNKLLQLLCVNHRPIFLKCEFQKDKGGIYNWMLRDGLNNVPLEKASGFQRFVVSLSMRIVLGKQGVAGLKNTQLFIDEGFTTCDNDNLGNIPDVLTKLLSSYSAIVLVSHLDDLKNGLSSFINIDRDATGLSQIQFGTVNTSLSAAKKIGRPRVARVSLV